MTQRKTQPRSAAARLRPVARQTPRLHDRYPLLDLAALPADRDDDSEAGRPATDHEARGWRAFPPAKP